jgi:hypothetical protein
MFKKELRVQEEPVNPKEETIKAAPRIVPLASDPDKPAPGPEKETLHQPGIIFSGLKEKLTSEELLKRME